MFRYYTSFVEEDSLNIIMEYAECGDLHNVREELIVKVVEDIKNETKAFLRERIMDIFTVDSSWN
jgi:serine/threonine protein kinase